uniref:ATP-binding cassette transporter subfamily G-like protein 9 n=2 Tax=Brachionus rotundiformis TaxID=96890 RepID=A0A7H9SQG4_9BILA|nr:ATP-binding cassette transporter subfamily G-like protein 9 [Brachionus rotundiformis]
MGASGAGKTTLLNILNFRDKSNLIIESDIRVNGRPVNLKKISEYSGYVKQNDIFIGTMTVKEWLTFQAFLRMGDDYTGQEKYDRVDEVIRQCNLMKAEDSYIGLGDALKGISGGEKRRLAFATEIITNPPLLFCDEPTSGLDAYMAIGLVEVMAEQARLGKTIICTIHQPSTQIYEKFNVLCLLSEGQVAYLGPRDVAPQYFSSIGYNCPRNYNPADYFISILSIPSVYREEGLIRSQRICETFKQSNYQANILQSINMLHTNYNLENEDYEDEPSGYKSSYIEQFKWLIWRNFITDIRTPISSKILLIQVLFIGVFFGLIYLNLKLDEKGVLNTTGLLFVTMMNVGFIFLFPILNVFIGEISVFYRDYRDRLYSPFIYYISKQIAEFPKYFLMSFILITIIYWMANVRNDAGVYFSILFTFILMIQCSMSFAYLISVATGSIELSTAIAGPILIPLILFAGYFLNNDSTRAYFVWIKYISWFYYTFEILMIELWTSYDSIPCSNPFNNVTTTNGTVLCKNARCYANGDAVLDQYAVKKNLLWLDIFLLFFLAIFMRALGYLLLKLRLRKN